MRPTTTTALALAGTALALPAGVALAETNDDPPSPAESALAAPFAGHLTMNAQMRAERREVLVERLTPRVIRTERKTARVKDADFSQRAARAPPPRRLAARAARRALRRAAASCAAPSAPPPPRRRRGTATASGAAAPPHLEAIAACESGGNPSTNTGNGFYGEVPVHAEHVGVGRRHRQPGRRAPEAEQDARAAQLYAQQGSSPWPVCGQ